MSVLHAEPRNQSKYCCDHQQPNYAGPFHARGLDSSQITLRKSVSSSVDITSPVSMPRSCGLFFGNAPKILGRVGA